MTSKKLVISVMVVFFQLTVNLSAAAYQKKHSAEDTAWCAQFNDLNTLIRDGKIKKSEALNRLRFLLPKIREYYYRQVGNAISDSRWVFPLQGYNCSATGGRNGNGYIAAGYDYFSGNKHGGHPAQDIFINDKNQDGIDDKTLKPVNVRSVTNGIVVATEDFWDTRSELRGGKYIWIFDPNLNCLFYYAHNSRIVVHPGDLVKAGDKIAEVGRTGFNAFKKRSPTHLHFMQLILAKDGYPMPVNCYEQLRRIN